jgi:hypothetical protein
VDPRPVAGYLVSDDNEALMTEWAAVAVAGLAAGYSSTPTSSGGAAGSGTDSGG